MENEKLHKNLQEISLELQDLRNMMEKYQELFSPNEDKGQIIARLREKIEEMEDFVVEIKEKGLKWGKIWVNLLKRGDTQVD